MRKYGVILVVGLLAVCCPRPAMAQYVTGSDLLAKCDSKEPYKVYSCINYIAGVIDYHLIMQSLGTIPTTDFCLPDNLPVEKATIAVMQYLRKSPEMQAFIAAPAVTMALHETYPCAKPRPKKSKKKK